MKGDWALNREIYTTISGEEWDVICFKHYGTEMVMDQVIQANPQYMHIAVFPAGIELILPEINIVQTTQNKPPWMR